VVPLPETALRDIARNQRSVLPSVEELAAGHVSQIRRNLGSRPLVLAGHCFGGLLAFEVAHQLQRLGTPIEAVLLLDTWMTRPSPWWRKKTWLKAHLGRAWEHKLEYLWGKSRRRVTLEKDALTSKLKLARNGDFSAHVPWPIIEQIYR